MKLEFAHGARPEYTGSMSQRFHAIFLAVTLLLCPLSCGVELCTGHGCCVSVEESPSADSCCTATEQGEATSEPAPPCPKQNQDPENQHCRGICSGALIAGGRQLKEWEPDPIDWILTGKECASTGLPSTSETNAVRPEVCLESGRRMRTRFCSFQC